MSISPLVDPENTTELEQAVLAAAIRREDVREIALAVMTEDWFLGVEHRRIFVALRSLVIAGAPVDATSLMRAARQGRASIADVPVDPDWVFRAIALGQQITGETFRDYHLPLLRDAYQMRRLEVLALNLSDRIGRASSPSDVVSWLSRELEDVDDDAALVESVRESDALERLLAEGRGEVARDDGAAATGVLTGIAELDRLDFRLFPREATVIGARPSAGKTSLGMEMVLGVAAQGIGCAVFGLEDGIRGWTERRAMMLTGERGSAVRTGRAEARSYHILDTAVRVARERDLPIWLYDNDRAYGVYDIAAILRRMKRRHPSLGLVMIDQMYDIDGWDKTARGEGRDQAPSRIFFEVVRVCRELDLCPLLLAQLNRQSAAAKNAEPTENDFADADVFAKRARQIVLLWRPHRDGAEADDVAVAKIAKRSHGATGRTELPWHGKYVRIGTYTDPLFGVPPSQQADLLAAVP